MGDRVLLTGDHPWKSHSGTLLSWDVTPFGRRPKVLLDNGQQVFVMKDGQWRPA